MKFQFLFRIRNNNLILLNSIIGPQLTDDLHDKIRSSLKIVYEPRIIACGTTDHNGES